VRESGTASDYHRDDRIVVDLLTHVDENYLRWSCGIWVMNPPRVMNTVFLHKYT